MKPKKPATQTSLPSPKLAGYDEAKLEGAIDELVRAIDGLPLAARVEALNRARLALHAVSPFQAEPVDCVLWVPADHVQANGWNPNAVAPPEMVALAHSMERYGITMPIVGTRTSPVDPLVAGTADLRARINDGFHRHRVGREHAAVRERIHGYLPLSFLKGDLSTADEMSATVLHNQARGTHSVVKEVAIVQALDDAGWTSEQVGVGTVKSDEELIRIRQLGGAAKNLASDQYAKAWKF